MNYRSKQETESQNSWFFLLALLLTCWNKVLHFSKLLFPHFLNGEV